MSGWHQTIIIGNVGRDPETKEFDNGRMVCNFSVAVTEKWTNDNGAQEKTTWYKVAAWNKLGSICAEYVHKGMKIMVSGNVEARGYTGNDGVVKASLELTARDVKFLGGERCEGQAQHGDDSAADIPF